MPHQRNRRGPMQNLLRFAAALAIALPATAVHAIAQRTFVSPNGADANTVNTCSLVSPCRSFGAAITVTNNAGEIIVLDSAGYGPVIITKSVSIISPPGIYAGVSVLTGEGITINTAGINVTLKGLTINGQGGSVGIHFTQGSRLDVDGCTISNMGQEGILVDGAGTITISDTTVIGNSGIGIHINAAAVATIAESLVESNAQTGIAIRAGANATIEHTTVVKNASRGISVHGVVSATRVAILSSVVADNTNDGIYAETVAASLVSRLDVTGTTVTRNLNGIQLNSTGGGNVTAGIVNNQVVQNSSSGVLVSGAGSVARVSWNAVFYNATGFNATGGGILFSPVTNYVRDNTTNGTATGDALL
ncbi:MAG: right-handed parallel beta-helix repeat-containing protein [Casimicrobiaceae bacterium]